VRSSEEKLLIREAFQNPGSEQGLDLLPGLLLVM
jgi:hypothetical protein